MILQLDSSVFDQRYSSDLRIFSALGLDNRGYFDFSIEDLKRCEALSTESLQEWELLNELYTRDSASFEMTNMVRVVGEEVAKDFDNSPPIISIKDAKKLLTTPFQIWLENGRNDKNFLMCALEKNIRKRLEEQIDEGKLRFDGKGGIGELKKNLLESVDSLTARVKVLVIIDSDCDSPFTPNDEPQRVINICEEKGIDKHCLQRRMIENYIPFNYVIRQEEQVNNESNVVKKWRAYRKFNRNQRYCFHLKRGFTYQHYEPNLYDDVSPEDRRVLQRGMGDSSAQIFADSTKYDVIHREMKAHDETSELDTLVQKVHKFTRLPK